MNQDAIIEEIVESAKLAVKAGVESAECKLLKESLFQKVNSLSKSESRGMSLKLFQLQIDGEITVAESCVISNVIRKVQMQSRTSNCDADVVQSKDDTGYPRLS